jgi:hypothetical protein
MPSAEELASRPFIYRIATISSTGSADRREKIEERFRAQTRNFWDIDSPEDVWKFALIKARAVSTHLLLRELEDGRFTQKSHLIIAIGKYKMPKIIASSVMAQPKRFRKSPDAFGPARLPSRGWAPKGCPNKLNLVELQLFSNDKAIARRRSGLSIMGTI